MPASLKSAVVAWLFSALAVGALSAAEPPPEKSRNDSANEVRHWIEDLKSSERAMQKEAERSLQMLGSQAGYAISPLVDALADPHHQVQTTAKSTLARIGKPAIPALIAALDSEFESIRNTAADALGEMGPTAADAISELIARLIDKERPLPRAANTLADIGPASIPALTRVLKDPQCTVAARTSAISSLGRLAITESGVVADLVEALQDRDEPTEQKDGTIDYPIRTAALLALAEIGPEAKPAVAALRQLLNDDDPAVRKRAAIALGSIGPDAAAAIDELALGLGDDDEIAVGFAEALGSIGPAAEAAAPALVALLLRIAGDSSQERTVAKALAEIGAAAVPHLVQAYGTADAEQSGAIIGTLARVGPKSEQVVPALIAAIDHEEQSVRVAALGALMYVGAKARPAVPAIARTLKDRDQQIRQQAAFTLFSIGPLAADAVPALIEVLTDRDDEVRKMAAWALFSIGSPARTAAPALRNATRDRKKEVRQAARRALERVLSEVVDTDATEPWREILRLEF